MDDDFALALQLQSELFDDQVDSSPKKTKVDNVNGKPMTMSLVDPYWEVTDPNPDVRALFLQFNDRFFWGRLAGIEVRWSPRMTLCAGLCCYEGRGGLCSVRLSVPLLKLRPRKDLVETLLHEMIHAYLFVTDNNKDHDGHGPEFHKHMYRINGEAGTSISVYHNFHDEVAAYKQHWWHCDGPCQTRKPYFGYVKRSMNRAPSKNDTWWAEHERSCGGRYTKVKEPEGYGKKKSGKKDGEEKKDSEKGKQKSKGKPPVKSMDIRVFGGEGKTLGQPKHSPGTNNSGSSKPTATATNSGSSKPTATVTSGVLERGGGLDDGGPRFGTKPPTSINKPSATVTSGVLHRNNSDVVSLSSDEESSLPGSKTPASKKTRHKDRKDKGSFKPVSQGGSATFDKMKKKKFVALDFSDSDDDEMCRLEEISNKEKNKVFGSGDNDVSTGEGSFSKHEFDTEDSELGFDTVDTDSIPDVPNGTVPHGTSGIPSVTADVETPETRSGGTGSGSDAHLGTASVDASDVRAMLRKVWGERQFSSSSDDPQPGQPGRPRPALTPLDPVRPHFQSASGGLPDISSRSAGVKRPSSDGDGLLQRKKKKTTAADNQYMIHSATGGSDKSPNKMRGSKHKGAEKVTSPIDNFFKKMEDKDKAVKRTDHDLNAHGNVSHNNPVGTTATSVEGGNSNTAGSTNTAELAPCPVCCKSVPATTINDHLDLCLTLQAIG